MLNMTYVGTVGSTENDTRDAMACKWDTDHKVVVPIYSTCSHGFFDMYSADI